MQTLCASLRFLCVVFSPSSSTPCGARPRRERIREEWTASPLSPAGEEPAGASGNPGPLPTSTTRGQQSLVAAAGVGEGARRGRDGYEWPGECLYISSLNCRTLSEISLLLSCFLRWRRLQREILQLFYPQTQAQKLRSGGAGGFRNKVWRVWLFAWATPR